MSFSYKKNDGKKTYLKLLVSSTVKIILLYLKRVILGMFFSSFSLVVYYSFGGYYKRSNLISLKIHLSKML